MLPGRYSPRRHSHLAQLKTCPSLPTGAMVLSFADDGRGWRSLLGSRTSAFAPYRCMSNKLKYIFFTYDGSALAVAKKLVDEGNAVITAQIRNASELHNGMTEDRNSRNKRLS